MLKFFVFCIPKHGKGEVDHTGGVAKSTIRWEIANGAFFADVTEMVLMVEGKFGDQQHPKYVIKKFPKNLGCFTYVNCAKEVMKEIFYFIYDTDFVILLIMLNMEWQLLNLFPQLHTIF